MGFTIQFYDDLPWSRLNNRLEKLANALPRLHEGEIPEGEIPKKLVNFSPFISTIHCNQISWLSPSSPWKLLEQILTMAPGVVAANVSEILGLTGESSHSWESWDDFSNGKNLKTK